MDPYSPYSTYFPAKSHISQPDTKQVPLSSLPQQLTSHNSGYLPSDDGSDRWVKWEVRDNGGTFYADRVSGERRGILCTDTESSKLPQYLSTKELSSYETKALGRDNKYAWEHARGLQLQKAGHPKLPHGYLDSLVNDTSSMALVDGKVHKPDNPHCLSSSSTHNSRGHLLGVPNGTVDTGCISGDGYLSSAPSLFTTRYTSYGPPHHVASGPFSNIPGSLSTYTTPDSLIDNEAVQSSSTTVVTKPVVTVSAPAPNYQQAHNSFSQFVGSQSLLLKPGEACQKDSCTKYHVPWKIGGWLRILACQTVCEACGTFYTGCAGDLKRHVREKHAGATPDITANPKKRILWEGVTSEKPRLRTVNPSATRGRPDLALSKSGTRTAQHPLRSDKKRRAYGWQKRAKARYLAGLGKKARLV